MHDTAQPTPRALLVSVILPDVIDSENDRSLAELGRLAETLGYEVAGSLSQRRRTTEGRTLVGEGKLQELAELAQDCDIILVNCELSPLQTRLLEWHAKVQVLDRTAVILEVFSRHARSREAKLQVAIAKLKYLAPRVGSGERRTLSGESSSELDKRQIRTRVAELRRELSALKREKSARTNLPGVALVGYTNAGKSSLMNALTGSDVLVADRLFATLDTRVRALDPPTIPTILISDTVGFIQKLPHDLIASFRSTLAEVKNAWLLLHVVDASDPGFRDQIEVTRGVLAGLEADEIPTRLVLNKRDKLTSQEQEKLKEEFPNARLVSALSRTDAAELRQDLVSFFERDMVDEEIFVPYTATAAIGPIRSQFRVLSESGGETGVSFLVRGRADSLSRARRALLAKSALL